jgi:hypothetical protein
MKNFLLSVVLLIALLGAVLPLNAQTAWQTTSAANVTLEYRVTADALFLECKLTGQTTGWVAVGFDPVQMMNQANLIIGYVTGGMFYVRDDWGTGNTAHVSDLSLGGTSDVAPFLGQESGGSTLIQFYLPLESLDQYDKNLLIGQTYNVILAHGSNGADNYTSYHSDAGVGTINILNPVANDDPMQPSYLTRIISGEPNPFRGQTLIRYYLGEKGNTSIRLYNSRGQLVYQKDSYQEAGEHSLAWDAAGLPAGNYLVRLQTGTKVCVSRLNLIR